MLQPFSIHQEAVVRCSYIALRIRPVYVAPLNKVVGRVTSLCSLFQAGSNVSQVLVSEQRNYQHSPYRPNGFEIIGTSSVA